MRRSQIRRALAFILFGVLLVLTVSAAACTTVDKELLEGLLQNVDAVNGEITIVTRDGKTITLKVSTQAPVQAQGASSALEALEPGTAIKVKVAENRQVAERIEARLAKVEGRIVAIEGNKVTVESVTGRNVTVTVTERTRIELDDDLPGTLADLRVGTGVETKFDPDTGLALKIDAEEEEAEIEGIIVAIDGREVTIETERGRRLALTVSDQTRIELEDDIPGTLADLSKGLGIEAKFDPFTRKVFTIEVEEAETAEIKGVIAEVKGSQLTIETEAGRRRTLVTGDRTRIEIEDGIRGTLADLQVGTSVEAKFDPVTGRALKVEIEEEEEDEREKPGKKKGRGKD